MAGKQLLEASKDLPSNPVERKELYNAARDLMLRLESPRDTQHRLFIAWPRPTIQIGIDLGVFRLLASDATRAWHVDEIGSQTGAEARLLHRLMRALAAHGTLVQVSRTTYQATNITETVAGDVAEKLSAGQFAFTAPLMHALPRQLAKNGYREPNDVNDSAFQLGHNTHHTPYYWLQENPEIAKPFSDMMSVQRAGQVCWTQQPEFLDYLATKYFSMPEVDVERGRPLFVDVGGGAGHQCIAICKNMPDLRGRVVLQDLEFPTSAALENPQIHANHIEVQAHDFNHPQPENSRGAKVYYIRNVLHNWDDEATVPILKTLRDAMDEDSVIILDEMVVSEMNASAATVNVDMIMMGFATAQRTAMEWKTLLSRAGLSIREMLCYDDETCDCLMVIGK